MYICIYIYIYVYICMDSNRAHHVVPTWTPMSTLDVALLSIIVSVASIHAVTSFGSCGDPFGLL